ncbi:MAG: hypothetical protein ACO1PI_12570 [Bacteroidota bacterium]
MIINIKEIHSLSNLLSFKTTGREQDWAIEFADKDKIDLFIDVLISKKLKKEEQQAMLHLIIASYDDYLFERSDVGLVIWGRITSVLNNSSNFEKYLDVLNYWAVWDEGMESNWFNVTSLVSDYIKKRIL